MASSESASDVDYARLREWFDRCVDLPESERLDWIERHVADPDLRLELSLMLASDSGSGDYFEAAPMQRLGDYLDDDSVLLPDLVGARCGAFRLLRLLGSGGQGAVYLAERDNGDFSQPAAVKLLRNALLDEADLRRFRRERDILARFEHPGVARLIDAGVGENGLPYLAMEYVDGEPIDVWCLQQGSDGASRLTLFAQLCAVIAAAHRQLIVHRDLKPSNVLVNAEGRIKVLDFGIARLLDDEAGGQTQAAMLTPGYGAPEQRTGERVTPASDVYALGVLLRELVAQQPPPRTSDRPWPAWPANTPSELRWIFARCCASAADDRYRDAAELLEDIERHRQQRPVLAHPPSGMYLARKFMARHRGGVAITALLLLTTLIGFAAALWQTGVARQQSARATHEAERARATSEFLLGVFQAAQEELPADARPTPDVLVQVAASKLEQDTTLPPAQRADFLVALGQVARYGNDLKAALPLLERAIAQFNAEPETSERLHAEVARAWVLTELGRSDEALAALEPRLDAIRALNDATSVDGLWAYASSLGEIGRSEEYLNVLDEARQMSGRVYAPDAIETLRLEGEHALALDYVGRHREASVALSEMLDRWHAAGHPEQRDYAVGLANLGLMHRALGNLAAAETRLREAVELNGRIHSTVHPESATALQMLGRVLVEQGRPDEAEPLLRKALSDLNATLGATHRQTIGAMSALGLMAMERFRYTEAVATLQAAARTCASIKSGDSANSCTSAAQLLAEALMRDGQLDAASEIAANASERRLALDGDDSPDNGPPRRIQAEILLLQGRAADALPLVDGNIALYVKAGIDQNLDLAAQHVLRARILLVLGRASEALAALDAASPILASRSNHHAARNLRLLATRAFVLAALERPDEAGTAAQQAMRLGAASPILDSEEWERIQVMAR